MVDGRLLSSVNFLIGVCVGLFLPAFSSEFTVDADALYWKANESGLSYALETRKDSSVLKQPKFEWDFGFKLALGYFLSHHQWDILLRLTHLHTHADSLLHAKEDKTLYPLWISSQENSPLSAEQIKMHWRLHLSFLDALAAKSVRSRAHFILYPQLGLRYALVRQKFNLEYRGGMFTPEKEEDLSMKNKFSGIGPYAALGMQWPFSRHFSLCANGGLSCPYGEFYLHQDEDISKGHTKIFALRDTFMRIVLIADANVVLRWQKIWEKSQKILSLQVGWDGVLLFKQNRLVRFFENSLPENASNLELKGWELGVHFNF